MAKVYTCKTCGAVATEPGHLCTPSVGNHHLLLLREESAPCQTLLQGQDGRPEVCLRGVRAAGDFRGFAL